MRPRTGSERRSSGGRIFGRAPGKPSDAPAWSEWQRQIGALITRPFPHRESDEVPGSEGLTYEAIFRFDQVASARRDWEALRLRLERLDALSAALGLAGKLPSGERQPLDIPEHFALSESGGRHRQLTKLYPHLEQALTKVKLPDSISGDLRRAARLSYDHLIEAGRQVVLKYLQQAATTGQETTSLWRGAREWLAGASELGEWRALATLLGRLMDLPTPDPVTALVAFLGLDHFDINIERVALEVPFDRSLAPAGLLTIYHAAPGAEPVAALTFRSADAEGPPRCAKTDDTFLVRCRPRDSHRLSAGRSSLCCLTGTKTRGGRLEADLGSRPFPSLSVRAARTTSAIAPQGTGQHSGRSAGGCPISPSTPGRGAVAP